MLLQLLGTWTSRALREFPGCLIGCVGADRRPTQQTWRTKRKLSVLGCPYLDITEEHLILTRSRWTDNYALIPRQEA